jgi:hypothetical protein
MHDNNDVLIKAKCLTSITVFVWNFIPISVNGFSNSFEIDSSKLFSASNIQKEGTSSERFNQTKSSRNLLSRLMNSLTFNTVNQTEMDTASEKFNQTKSSRNSLSGLMNSLTFNIVNQKEIEISLSNNFTMNQRRESFFKKTLFFNIHIPEISYLASRSLSSSYGMKIGMKSFSFDIAKHSFNVGSNFSIQCIGSQSTNNHCTLLSPVMYGPQIYNEASNGKNFNITVNSLTKRNFFSSMLGTLHWVDVVKVDQTSSNFSHGLLLGSTIDPDVSNGGKCILFNTDNYYYSNQCIVKEPNFLKLYANILDSNVNSIGAFQSLTSWSLRGPFAMMSNTMFISGNHNVNATFE